MTITQTKHDPATCINSVPCMDCEQPYAPEVRKLAALLKEADVDPKDFFEDCYQVNDAMQSNGLNFAIGLDWFSTQDSGAVHVSFYSDKIKHSIKLDSDMNLEYESLEDMAQMLFDYEKDATKLEAALLELPYSL